LDGTANTNPYNWAGSLPTLNKWYLVVGIIHGSGYSGTANTGVSGVYDPDTGVKVQLGSDFKNTATATVQQQRVYLYYANTASSQSLFADPRFELIGSDTPSLVSLMNAGALTNKTIEDNIYTANTTTIAGSKITTGTVTADKVTLSENIELTGSSSGVIFQKTSLTDGTHGAFYGRSVKGGTSVAGFAISSPSSSVLMDSSGTFRLIGVDIYTGSPGAVTQFTVTGTHYYNLGVATSALDISVVAAGGSGSSNASNATYGVNGNAGQASSVTFYSGVNGTGAYLGAYTTTGGAGAVYSVQTNLNTGVGAAGAASSKSAGGAGGSATSPSTTPAVGYGAGGGSPGARGSNGSDDAVTNNGGGAGSTVVVTTVPAGTLSVRVVVGSGGAQASIPSGATSAVVAGAAGGGGYVSISNPAGGGTLVDLEDIWSLPTQASLTTSTMTGNTNGGYASLNLGAGGAGWYYFQDFTAGCLLLNVKSWRNNSSNSDGILNNFGDTGGMFYCNGTPRLYSLRTGNNNSNYSGGTIKWVKID
tara:strand:- start:964 stop:2559 length:1596 start_codon:yes stop_codon:yes gene_type:complete